MSNFNPFGNLMPSNSYKRSPYLLHHDPTRIIGNLYFAGDLWCSSHLIDTGEGLILLDVPPAGALPGLIDRIYQLGFNLHDVKYLVISHAHSDHFGSVNALVHLTGAKTFLSAADAKDMRDNPQRMQAMNDDIGAYNECFTPDVELEDGDIIQLGNTSIRCVLTPGHTIGVMSHFWTAHDQSRDYKVGIYGGAGFVSLSKEALERRGQPLSLQQDFLDSIQKVWDEPVDVTLGNHPFHNDTFQKAARRKRGDETAFVDPEEWQRFLGDLKERFASFLTMSREQVAGMYQVSQWDQYVAMIRQAEEQR